MQGELFLGKCLGGNCLGRNFMVGQLSGGFLSSGELFKVNCAPGKSPEDNYPWGKPHGGNCLEGLCYRGNNSGIIVCRAKVLGVILCDNCLGHKSPGGSCPRGNCH